MPQKKQLPPTADRLKRLFTSLCAQIDGGHFINALKTCDKILRLEPNDADATQTKLFLLLHTEQYETALSIIGNGYDFEKTYSLYRLQREEEAQAGLDILKTMHKDQDEDGQEAMGIMHLEAQLNYRKGSYQIALDLYNQLLDTADSNSEEHSDILTNLQASQSHLEFIESTYLRSLSALPTSISSSLETVPPAATITSAAAADPQDVKADLISKPKKARPSRVPKGVTPGITPAPDPERWLKKSERSTFGQGTGKRRRGGASQGAAVVDTPSSGAGAGAKGGGKKKGKK